MINSLNRFSEKGSLSSSSCFASLRYCNSAFLGTPGELGRWRGEGREGGTGGGEGVNDEHMRDF